MNKIEIVVFLVSVGCIVNLDIIKIVWTESVNVILVSWYYAIINLIICQYLKNGES